MRQAKNYIGPSGLRIRKIALVLVETEMFSDLDDALTYVREEFPLTAIAEDEEQAVADDLNEIRNWINDLPIPRPKGTTHISMVIAQAMTKLGVLD